MAAPSHGGMSEGDRGPDLGLCISSDLACLPPPLSSQVNGVLRALPVSEANGQLSVTHGASKAVLATDFGLQVTYDWNWRVEVTLPSSYHSAVCGLCGNMDRNLSNDQAFPNGTLAPSIPIWGGSWRVPGWDPLCWDECQGSCPTCAEDRLEEYGGPGFCGPLVPGSGGPFATCHEHVAPDSFFKGCVLDVCLGGGAKDILCQALAAYAAACQAAGIVIKDWRTEAGCGERWGQGSRLFGAGLISFQSFRVCLFVSLCLAVCLLVSWPLSLVSAFGCLFLLFSLPVRGSSVVSYSVPLGLCLARPTISSDPTS